MHDQETAAAVITAEQRLAVEALLRQPTLKRRVRERAEMVKAAALGYDSTEIARWSGRSVRRVRHWLARFATFGVAGLSDGTRRGRPVKADAAYRAALKEAVMTPPPALGLPFDVWTSDRLSAYLAETTGTRIAPGWIRSLLNQQDFVTGRPKHTLKHLQDAAAVATFEQQLSAAGKKVAAEPDRYELHHQDETHLETNPYLSRVWHRRGQQPTVPAAGTNRRLTVFGSVEVFGRGRVEVLGAGQTSVDFLAYLEVLEQRHQALGKEIFLVLDNGPCHRSKRSEAALTARADWRHVLWLPKYCPHLNKKERGWRYLKRDARSHLARTLRAFADGILAGLARLGGERLDIVDRVPDWFLVGHRTPPTGRPPGRPTGSKDSYPRVVRRRNLPAAT